MPDSDTFRKLLGGVKQMIKRGLRLAFHEKLKGTYPLVVRLSSGFVLGANLWAHTPCSVRADAPVWFSPLHSPQCCRISPAQSCG